MKIKNRVLLAKFVRGLVLQLLNNEKGKITEELCSFTRLKESTM